MHFVENSPCPSGVAARRLGVSARTIRHWRKRCARKTLCPRGRPLKACPPEQRNAVIHFLHRVTGPCVSLDALRGLFPDIPRCILAQLVCRYRRVWKRRYARSGFRLTWHRPGRVWAIDHSEATHSIDGSFSYIFAVRDLASHCQLAWTPCRSTGSREAVAILSELFTQYGPPLILKSDNGSAFVSDQMGQLLLEHTVARLFNPPRRPQYNGALERSNGTLKVYTQQQAIAEGHPFRWTSDDLERARNLANTISRPWGHRGPTPEQAWNDREPLGPEERTQFQIVLGQQRAAARVDLGFAVDEALTATQQAQLDRLAITRSAEALGYLAIKRRRHSERPRRIRKREALALAAANPPRGSLCGAASVPETKQKSTNKKLASSAPRVTMPAARPARALDRGVADVPCAPPRRTILTWFRRCITPILNFAKAAKIMH